MTLRATLEQKYEQRDDAVFIIMTNFVLRECLKSVDVFLCNLLLRSGVLKDSGWFLTGSRGSPDRGDVVDEYEQGPVAGPGTGAPRSPRCGTRAPRWLRCGTGAPGGPRCGDWCTPKDPRCRKETFSCLALCVLDAGVMGS